MNKLMMDETSLKNASHIRYIGITATGKNNIDFDYTKSRGICVTNVAGYSTDVVAQHTFAMTLYLLEHLRYYDEYVKSGEYTKSRTFCHMGRSFYELSGKTGDFGTWSDRQQGGSDRGSVWVQRYFLFTVRYKT